MYLVNVVGQYSGYVSILFYVYVFLVLKSSAIYMYFSKKEVEMFLFTISFLVMTSG